MLTQKDIKKLINACNHPRDQALIAILYESAGRAEEIVRLKVGSIVFDEFGAKVALEGNTGARVIRLVDSVPYLQTWLNVHPYRDNPKAALWCKIRKGLGNDSIQYHNVRKLVVGLAKDVGIKKPCTPHKLRHARLTELAKYLPEQKLKVYAGWTPGSRMTGTYVHLSGKDLDDDILQLHGITPKKLEKPLEKGALKTQQCVRCKRDNPATAQYCQCGMILDKKLAIEKMNQEANIEELRKQLEGKDERLVELERKVEELTGALNKESIFDKMALNLDPNVTEKAFGEAVRRATREWFDSLSDPKQAVQSIYGYLEAKQKERKKKEKT